MAVAITRTDMSARELRLAASNVKDSNAARRMLAIAWYWRGWPRGALPRPAAWTGRRCAIGFTASTPKGWRGCRTVAGLGRRRC
jgi:hypothetical protein